MQQDLEVFQTLKHVKATALAALIKDKIVEGEINPLELAIFLKKMEKICKSIMDSPDTREIIDKAAIAYAGEKGAKLYSADVEYAQCHTAYDYSRCNSTELIEWERVLNEAKSNIKRIQERLQKVSGEEEVLITNVPRITIVKIDGDLETIYPPKKSVKMGAKFNV